MMDEEETPLKTATKRYKRINRRTKTEVLFDEKARREFLTGFRKRKLERKQKAKEKLQEQIKQEKKRIRLEAKEGHKKLIKSYEGIPELEERLAHLDSVQNSKVEVSILELDTDLLASNNFIIGTNKVKYKESDDEDQENDEKASSLPVLTSKKQIDKETKKKAAKLIKKSRPIQQFNKQLKIQQRKKSMQQKNKLERTQRKTKKKGKKKHNKNVNM